MRTRTGGDAARLRSPKGGAASSAPARTTAARAAGKGACEVAALAALLARFDLHPLDEATAALAVAPGASYGRKPADTFRLATAVSTGADRFITNNARDFSRSIERSRSPTRVT